jgi:hypothetical protein
MYKNLITSFKNKCGCPKEGVCNTPQRETARNSGGGIMSLLSLLSLLTRGGLQRRRHVIKKN